MSARLHARPLVLVNKCASIVVNCSGRTSEVIGLPDGLPWRYRRCGEPFIVVRHGWNASYFAISSSVSYTGAEKYGTEESHTSRQ